MRLKQGVFVVVVVGLRILGGGDKIIKEGCGNGGLLAAGEFRLCGNGKALLLYGLLQAVVEVCFVFAFQDTTVVLLFVIM